MNYKSGLFTSLKVCLPLLALCAALPAGATTYYVDVTNGNNSWSGTSSNYVSGTTGPWLNFANINYGSAHQLQPGDVVYAMAGVLDHSNDANSTCLFLAPLAGNTLSGTSNNPIIISNYPGAYFTISNSGTSTATISINSASWIKLFGINSTNAYRGPTFQFVTNCEIAYCNFGGGNTNYGYLNPFTMYNFSQHNWVHNNLSVQTVATAIGDSTHNMTFGLFTSNNDFTCYNIIESNICVHAGHDAFSCYGPSNVIQYNWVHDDVWYYRSDYGQMTGKRDVELGGNIGNYNLLQYNDLDYAGVTGSGGSHGVEMSDAAYEIVRFNRFADNAYSGLMVYGGKSTDDTNAPLSLTNAISVSNYVYNNTFAYNGFGQRYFTNYPLGAITIINGIPVTNGVASSTTDNAVYQTLLGTANTSNNFFVNNLFYGCNNNGLFASNISTFDGWSVDIARWANNLTNVDPLFANSNSSGSEYIRTLPDLRLTAGSPAIDAGAFLTTITSPTGSGTTFTVADPNYFFAGLTAAGHTIPGDTIQLQGQQAPTNTATITSISGNTITVNTSLSWTNGQWLALPYGGNAPDVGAYEYYLVASPTNLRVVPP